MNISVLAKEMGVTEGDVNSLLNMVSNSLRQDGMAEEIVEMNEDERVVWVNAYVQSEVKKFKEFCFSILTNDDKKDVFLSYVHKRLNS